MVPPPTPPPPPPPPCPPPKNSNNPLAFSASILNASATNSRDLRAPVLSTEKIKWLLTLSKETRLFHPAGRIHSLHTVQARASFTYALFSLPAMNQKRGVVVVKCVCV